MTKSTLGDGVKPSEVHTGTHYVPVPVIENAPVPRRSFATGETTCWYVLGVLSTIFCCLPCGVIGLVHALIAKHEGERGNYAGHRQRLSQAKCWTCWSIALGLVPVFFMVLYMISVSYGYDYEWCQVLYANYTMYNETTAETTTPLYMF